MGASISRFYQSNRSVKSLVSDNEELREEIKKLDQEIDILKDILEEKDSIISDFLKTVGPVVEKCQKLKVI